LVSAIEANNSSRGANYIERFGEGYVVRTSGRVETLDDIGNIVVSARKDIPVHVKDVAEVTIGRDLRAGSASMNAGTTACRRVESTKVVSSRTWPGL